AQALHAFYGAGLKTHRAVATKSSHGHMIGATGAMEFLLGMVALREGWAPPVLHHLGPDDGCDMVPLILEAEKIGQRLLVSNSFAFGGLNAVHDAFVRCVAGRIEAPTTRRLFERMVERAGIEQRFSYLEPVTLDDGTITDSDGFYGPGEWPGTDARMARYERDAPRLGLAAISALGDALDPGSVTHLVVASCTGFMAPGLDQRIAAALGLDPGVERTVVGFMGCYAAVNSLRLAHHIVRSQPAARVLVLTLELCTLHFQKTLDLERLLAMLLFGDGAAVAL
ncbi:hypothetical protein LTR94_028279, partial [Friedmanniomyces endolithicus]